MRPGLVVVTLLSVSAFGPYLIYGVRTDQAVTYILAAIVLPFAFPRIRLSMPGIVTISAWMIFVVVSALMWATGGAPVASAWGRGSVIAGADALLLPVATFLLVSATVPSGSIKEAVGILTRVVSLGMCVNAGLALIQYLAPAAVSILSSFWGSGGTAERALTVGRYTGIAGQPSVAGIMYSLALVFAIYSFRDQQFVKTLVVAALVLGGVLTLSKGFLLGGLPIAAIQMVLTSRRFGQRATLLLSGMIATYAATTVGVVSHWRGFDRLSYLIPGGGATLQDYTGNRYGSLGSSAGVIDEVLSLSPIGGYGLVGVQIATDTAFVHALVFGGLVGVACVAVVTMMPLVTFWRRRESMLAHDRLLMGGLALIVLVSSAGAPILVSNRASVIVWAMLALLLRPVPSWSDTAREGHDTASSRLISHD